MADSLTDYRNISVDDLSSGFLMTEKLIGQKNWEKTSESIQWGLSFCRPIFLSKTRFMTHSQSVVQPVKFGSLGMSKHVAA